MTTKFINNASNVSSSEYLQVVNNAAGLEYGVKAALAPISEEYYPDNPAKDDVIPHEDSAERLHLDRARHGPRRSRTAGPAGAAVARRGAGHAGHVGASRGLAAGRSSP